MQATSHHTLEADNRRRQTVLSQATVRAADILGLTNAELAKILGVSDSTITRLKQGGYLLKQHSGKEFELAQIFLRLFRGLNALYNGEDHSTRQWVRNPNTALGACPIDLIKTARGLVSVADYVDSRRAPI